MESVLKEPTIDIRSSDMVPGELGIFALRDFRKGEELFNFGEAEDEFLTDAEFALLSPALQEKIVRFVVGRPGGYCVFKGLDFDLLPIAFYINHSCEGNLGCSAEGDLVALRDIAHGEELTYDYGLVEAKPEFIMHCTCGTPSCRKIVTGNDWRDPSFRASHKDFLHPDLRPEPQ